MAVVVRKQWLGGAKAATGATTLTAGAATLDVGSGQLATWTEDGSGAPFNVIINRGKADEEKLYATGRSGNSLTGLTRGRDGSVDQQHVAPFTVEHGLFAEDENAANALLSLPQAEGDLLVGNAVDDWIRVPVGANNTILRANASATGGVEWSATLAGLTLDTPTIANFNNAQHDHGDADDGGTITIAAVSDLATAWAAYVPTWTASVTNPTLGNGTAQGRYKQVGKIVHFVLEIVGGSTTTFGSGTYSFGLPVACVYTGGWVGAPVGSAYALASTTQMQGVAQCVTATTVQATVTVDAAGVFGGVVQLGSATAGWGSGAPIRLAGTYEAA